MNRWIVWLGQDYNITYDRPALQVVQTNETQIGKQIKHKLQSLKLLDNNYKKTRAVNTGIPNPGIPDCFAIPKSRDYDRVIPRISGSKNGPKCR